jgi:hypothetical protein
MRLSKGCPPLPCIYVIHYATSSRCHAVYVSSAWLFDAPVRGNWGEWDHGPAPLLPPPWVIAGEAACSVAAAVVSTQAQMAVQQIDMAVAAAQMVPRQGQSPRA